MAECSYEVCLTCQVIPGSIISICNLFYIAESDVAYPYISKHRLKDWSSYCIIGKFIYYGFRHITAFPGLSFHVTTLV